jgi:hypothetical protein
MFTYACAAALALISIAGLAEGIVAVAVADGGRPEVVRRPHDRAVDAAARGFRLQIYDTYRLDRVEFERRRAAWEHVQARWRAAGSRPEEQQALIRWLEEATQQSRLEVRGALPEMPTFGPLSVRSEPGMQSGRRASRGDTVQPVQPATVPGANRGPSGRTTSPGVLSVRPTAPWELPAPPSTRQSADVTVAPPKPGSLRVPAAVDAVESPARTTGTPKPLAAIARGVPAIDPELTPLTFDVNQKPVATNPRAIRSKLNRPNTLDVDEATVPRDVPAIAAPRTRDGNVQPQAADTVPPRRIALARPATAPAAPHLPDRAARPMPTIDSRSTNTADFNFGELWARASGYSVGLRTVDSTLQEEDDVSPSDLAKLLDELEELLNQRRDLLLYEQLVSAADRERLVRSLAFPQATVAGLGSRIAKARERLVGPTSNDTAERDRQLQTLEKLSLRLSRVHQE